MAANVRDLVVPENTIAEIESTSQEIVEFRRQQPLNNRALFIMISSIYKRMADEMTINAEYYDELKRNFSNIPTTSTNLLLRNIGSYSRNLRELIKMLHVTMHELDSISIIVEYVRFISSLLSLLKNIDAIFNYEISNTLTNQAFDRHPVLCVISQLFWTCVPQSVYLRFLSSVGHRLGSWWYLRKLLKSSNTCKESFEEIKQFFRESNEMNEEVTYATLPKNFAQWDSKLVDDVENILYDHSTQAKTFTVLYVSALISSSFMVQRFDFLTELFKFSKSTLGVQWYQRNLLQDLFPKMTIKTGKADFMDVSELSKSSVLMDFAMLPETTINILESSSKITVEDPIQTETISASPFIYGFLDSVFIYFSIKELRSGAHSKNSPFFRNVTSSAELRLKRINIFLRKYALRNLAIDH